MLCLGPKKSLLSLRLKLMAQGMAQHTNDQSRVWYHSAIQVPNLAIGWMGQHTDKPAVTSASWVARFFNVKYFCCFLWNILYESNLPHSLFKKLTDLNCGPAGLGNNHSTIIADSIPMMLLVDGFQSTPVSKLLTLCWKARKEELTFYTFQRSVTRLGDFWKSWWQIFLQKWPKYLMTFWALGRHNF